MRLAEFISANTESILAEWEAFARSIKPGAKMDALALRDHAEDILRATARDMMNAQTAAEQASKSTGRGSEGSDSQRLTGASEVHGSAASVRGSTCWKWSRSIARCARAWSGFGATATRTPTCVTWTT